MKYVVSHAVKYIDSPLYPSTLWIPAVENLQFLSVTQLKNKLVVKLLSTSLKVFAGELKGISSFTFLNLS